MKRIQITLWALVATALLAPAPSTSAASRVLPFQGRLTAANGGSIPDGSRVVQFKIYDAPVGGKAVWNGEVHNLSVNSGLVSTLLGTKASLAEVDFNQDLYLELTIDANGDSQISLTDPPLLPRQSILPAIFASESANAHLLGGYGWNTLFGTNNPAEGALLPDKIADNSLTSAKIVDGAITASKIPNGAVLRSKLDTTGAVAGQSLTYNGTQVTWSHVNALNADTLDGFDWSSIFNNANPANGELSVANLRSRGGLTVAGNAVVSGTLFASVLGSSVFLGNNNIFLRNNGDFNHFIGYANGWFSQTGFDGPLLVGVGGGMLGTGANWTLRWNANGTVQARSTVTWGSDRNIKENFSPVNSQDILSGVIALPITRWNYKDDPTSPHLGPVSQDFSATFGLGSDDKSISAVDADGVALAAIQGLNRKVEDGDKALQNLLKLQQEQIDALKAEISALKAARQ